MEDWDIPIKKETYHQFYDWVQSIGYKSWNRQYAHDLFVKEEHQEWYYQDHIGILTHSSIRDIEEIEDGNHQGYESTES